MNIDSGIHASDREAIVDGLNRLLADTFTLYLTTHNFHWNVTGPMFHSLHGMFLAQYTELWNAVDPIAERIRSLGNVTPGSYEAFKRLGTLPDAPSVPPKALEMVATLAHAHESVVRAARLLLDRAHQVNDAPTSDLLSQRMAAHEQAAWMLRALLA